MRRIPLAIALVVALFACATASGASRRPVITSATYLGAGQVEIKWTGTLGLGFPGAVVRVKRDCLLTCGVGAIYREPDTGDVILNDQPSGTHFYRVCDTTCSLPVKVCIGYRPCLE